MLMLLSPLAVSVQAVAGAYAPRTRKLPNGGSYRSSHTAGTSMSVSYRGPQASLHQILGKGGFLFSPILASHRDEGRRRHLFGYHAKERHSHRDRAKGRDVIAGRYDEGARTLRRG